MEVANLFVKISADTTNAINQLNKFDDKFKQIGMSAMKIGVGMSATITAPIVAIGSKAFGMASDFEETLNKINVAFQGNAQEVIDWSETTIDQFGIASGTALEMASLFGDMGTSMGLTTDEASQMSMSMVGLAGDLASFKNVQLDVAQTALSSIFTGETESLKKLGIVMTETNLEAFALSQGITKNIQDMTQAEKVQLRYAFVTESSKNAIGDFSNTSDSSANTVRTLQEQVKELTTELGQELLPIITPIIRDILDLVKKFSNLDDGTKKLIVQIGLFLAVAGPIITIVGGIISLITPLITLVSGLGAVFAFIVSPIGLVIAAIVGLIAIGVLLWKNWDSIKEMASNVWKWVTEKFGDMVDFISNIDLFQAGKDLLTGLWDGIKDIWNGLWTWVSDIGKKISDAILGKQQEINDFNNNANAYTGMGVNQTVVINSPKQLSPSEVGKQTAKASRTLALGL